MKCAVITPIGPGHSALYQSHCAGSITAAIDFDRGPFSEILTFAMDDSEGRFGRSNRRNTAVQTAKADGIDWVFFLDADDTLAVNAFEAFGRCLAADMVIDAVWGLICEANEHGELSLREGQVGDIDSFDGFLATAPWQAVQIGGFVKTSIAATHPFDETMDTGEDYKLYLALWKNHRCQKVPEIFFVNHRGQPSTGPRAATGQDWRDVVDRMWADSIAAYPVWAKVDYAGTSVQMRVTNPLDLIQAAYIGGQFFDEAGLVSLGDWLPSNPILIDVGANIGNVSIWFGSILQASRIFPVEPNPEALQILEANLAKNGLADRVDRRGMGLGVGRISGRFNAKTPDENNLGATHLEQDAQGAISVVSLDDLMAGETADILKIDAEGMEMDVLEGAADLIKQCRPVIWVEVLRKNQLAFAQQWCRRHKYRLCDAAFYVHTVDYLALPEERF